MGVPTLGDTLGGAPMKTRSAEEPVEKSTAWLKVTVSAPGATVTVDPLAGLVETTRRTSTALIAWMALISPKPDWGCHDPAGVLFMGWAESISPWRICAGVRVGTFWSIR